MDATCQKNQTEVLDNIHAFFRRTGIVSYFKELEWLGFEPNKFSGSFRDAEVVSLINFCENDSDYHIVTMTHPGQMENRYVPGKRIYLLARGDKNPNLALNPFLHKSVDLFTEEVFDKIRTMVSEVDGGDEVK